MNEFRAYILKVSEDNEYCMEYKNGIYSSDGKVFYQGIITVGELKEGVERIAPRAFWGNFLIKFVIPESVKYIGDEAFANICMLSLPTRNEYTLLYIVCKCTSLPELGERVFSSDEHRTPVYRSYNLYVKEELIGLYKATPQWSDFNIKGWNEIPKDYEAGIEVEKNSDLVVNNNLGLLEVKNAGKAMSTVELINLNGEIIQSKLSCNNQAVFNIQNIASSIIVLKIIYSDGEAETIKLNI